MEAFPTDAGRLDAEDLGDEVVSAFGAADAAAPARDTTATCSIAKPPITNIRARRYRLVVPKELRRVLRDWRASARIVKNEAIRLVNQASQDNDDRLKPYTLFNLLVNNDSDFIQKRPFLSKCPTYTRRQVIVEAISARKSLITKHYTTPWCQRTPIPAISRSTAAKDRKKGFTVALDPQSGSIDFEKEGPTITSMTLKVAPRIVKRAGADPNVEIRLRGQRQRQSLLELCNRRRMGKGDKYQLPREWGIQCDHFGHWYLVVQYQLAPPQEFDRICRNMDRQTAMQGK